MKSDGSISIFSEFGTGKRIDNLSKIIPVSKQKRELMREIAAMFPVGPYICS
jgi:hypothetical protein